MKKLIQGIVDFRTTCRSQYLQDFSHLSEKQTPDALFIACSDSRVVPNTFASTNPGDLFVVRNMANLVPPYDLQGESSEGAAIEFAVNTLKVRHIIVCGHSECGGIQKIFETPEDQSEKVGSWLRHGTQSSKQKHQVEFPQTLAPHNCLSQANVLQQLEHLKTYPFVQQKLEAGTLGLHGWWFDLQGADVYAYEKDQKSFVLIDEEEAQVLLERMAPPSP